MTVVGVRQGTKAFGEMKGTVGNGDSSLQTMSSSDREKMGGNDLGAVLNKVADPNWVDPTKKMRTTGNSNLDKDAFFKLMLAQMKNQDPTNPMKSHEMAAQLANFSSLEQMQNINSTLTEMKNGQKPSENFQALNLIGKAVSGDSAQIIRAQGDKIHEIKFNLPDDSSETSIKIQNADSKVVRTYEMKNLKKGENKIDWNGQDDQGSTLPEGDYRVLFESKSSNGQKLAIKTSFEGPITGLSYTKEGPVLLVGNQAVRMKDVKKIVNIDSLDLKSKDLSKENVKEEDVPPAPAQQSAPKLMSEVGMSREMLDRVAKEIN